MNNIALGRYIPLDSPLHKLDPRAKIVAMFALLIAIFIDTGFSGYAILGVIILIGVLLAKLQFNFIWKAMKPKLIMLAILLVINHLVIKNG